MLLFFAKDKQFDSSQMECLNYKMDVRLDNASLTFNRISMPARAFETGQFSFGVGGVFLECRIIDARNVRRRFEFDPCDGKSLIDLFEGHACPRLKMSGRETSA